MSIMGNNANFKVFQASAGAGKTFTLIKEFLELCLKSQDTVSNFKNILAITFTNAAANEMKAKIINNLCDIINSKMVDPNSMEAALMGDLGIGDAELKANAKQLLTCIMHDYSSFCVSTIDAFVQKLSRSFAHDLGLPSQYTVSIDAEEMAETITEMMGLQLGDENAYLTQILIDFSENQFDNQRSNDLESKLSEFVIRLMTEKAYQKDENNNIKDAKQYKQALDALYAETVSFEAQVKSLVDRFRVIEKRYGLITEDYSNGKTGFVSFINKLERKVYEPLSPRLNKVVETRNALSTSAPKRFDKNSLETINTELLEVLDLLHKYYGKNFGRFLFYKTQRDLLYLYALRTQIRIEFDRLAADEEVVHISEFNKLLNKVMGDFSVPFVYERIGEHFRHVFVDEFQDTSVLQWQNLLPLVDNGLSANQMSMVVGDGKQSIYRFRSGEVEQIVSLPDIYALPEDERKAAFEQFQKNLRNNFSFKNLDTNYRSYANVVKFNNDFFERTYKLLSEDLQKVYVDKKPGTEEGVEVFQKNNRTDEGLVQVELYDPEKQEDYCFDRVEAIIRELTGSCGYRYADITLLTRKTDYGSEMANYLNDRGIPVISQVSILLKSSDKVQLLVNTLRYLIYDSNEPIIANLLYYWRMTRQPDIEGNVSGWFDSVKDIARGKTAIETVMGIGEAGLLRNTLSKATCLYDLCASLMRLYHFDTIRDAFLNYFMEEVFKWQSGMKESIAEFLNYWDKQDNLSVKSVSGNAVKIMTIHKSKGLEFPVVIYPEAITNLNERINTRRSPEEWLKPEDLGFDAIPNLEKVLFKLDKNAENMGELALQKVEKEKESNRLDNLNLLYVAFTRAVQRLYVIAKQGEAEQTNIIYDFLKDKEANRVPVKESGENALMYRFGSSEFRNPKEIDSTDNDGTALTDSASADWFGKIDVDPNPTLLWSSENERMLPREWGELVHQILSKVRTVDKIDEVLSPFILEGSIDASTATWMKEMFQQMAGDATIGAAFSPAARIKTECEVLYQGEVLRFDRYAELPDVVYLLDYKTGKKDPKHQKQLVKYVTALKCMIKKDVRAYLVYLSEGVVVERLH